MENDTGIELGDHVQILGGFEDGVMGQVTDIDLSGEVKDWPRFTIYTDRTHEHNVSRLPATRLVKFWPAGGFVEDTGFWEDGAQSWVATMNALDGTPCQIRIRNNSTSGKVFSDSIFWMVCTLIDGTADRRVDQGDSPSVLAAQQHAVRAVVWHGARGT